MSKTTQPTPSLDAVLVWVTFTIEQDYSARGAFPKIRAHTAALQHGSASLHYMTAESVQPVLEDAKRRRDEVRKGLRHAYNCFVKGLEGAIKEAEGRREIFEAQEPVCTHKSDYTEYWRGSKEQLIAMGIKLPGAWPGEPGGKERWAKTCDGKGREAYLTPYSRTWSGLFEVRIEIPEGERKLAKDAEERAKKRAVAEMNLDDMPADEDEFRMKVVQTMRRMMAVTIHGEQHGAHGYRLTEEGVTSILLSCDAVVEAIMEAEVSFDSRRHEEIEMKYRQEIAETDLSFQRVLDTLTTVSPEVLEGADHG